MPAFTADNSARGRCLRAGVLLAGLVLCQAVLFGPSLAGQKILLPLDILALDRFYLPATPEYRSVVPHNPFLTDQVLNYEFSRRFAAGEFRAGRLPLWDPYSFAGAPFAHFGKYSPFSLVYYAFPSPKTLAWIQLVKSLVAGVGAYLFFRRALGVGFWPAAFGAWCYPLTGFVVLWQGYPLTFVTAWLPYVLLASDSAVRRPWGWGGPALAVSTALTILSGHVDVGGQVLLASGIYAGWCWLDQYGTGLVGPGSLVRGWRRTDWQSVQVRSDGLAIRPTAEPMPGGTPAYHRGVAAVAATAGGWALGFLLSAPYLLPLLEYAQTGARMVQRRAGIEERPPGSLAALPQTVLPDYYGSMQTGSFYIGALNQLESAAAAYTGLLATLVLVPLAWCSRRHWSVNVLWAVLVVVGLAWVLNIPGLVALLRLPGLNMLSHNRFVFVASFGVLAMAVIGLEVLGQGGVPRAWWFAIPLTVLIALGGWCWGRSGRLPEPIATQLERDVRNGATIAGVPDLAAVRQVRRSFARAYTAGAVLCGVGVAGWLLILSAGGRRGGGPLLGGLALGELLWFAYGLNPQCEPGLYYPEVPVLARLAQAPPGRVLAVACLPSNLNEAYGLRDVRGYDGIDPQRLVELLDVARDKSVETPTYASTQWYTPVLEELPSGGFKVPAVLNMLNVRYLIFRGSPPPGVRPFLHQDDYWVWENADALPRAFVPRKVETVTRKEEVLARLGSKTFNPRELAYVDQPVSLSGNGRGTAEIIDEIPTRVTLSLDMETPGLVVLSDQWYEGWKAYLDGRAVPVLRVNHALRGVEVPAGRSVLVFRYEPASLVWGMCLMVAGVAVLLLWSLLARTAWCRRLACT